MTDFDGVDIRLWSGCVRVMKKQEPLFVRFATTQGSVYTLEGEVAVREGDAVLQRTPVDIWPVPSVYFTQAYTPCPGSTQGQDGWFQKKPILVWAVQMPTPFSVRIQHGSVLHGKSRDWLVQYDDEHHGIVAEAIFSQSYVRVTSEAE